MSAVADNLFNSVEGKFKRMRREEAIYFWNWETLSLKEKKCPELDPFARNVTNHISNTPLQALFLAHQAKGRIENSPSSA